MATFNPDVPDRNAPDYRGYSRPISQPEGNKSGLYRGQAAGVAEESRGVSAKAEGSLAEGLGSIFKEGVSAVDNFIKEGIKNKVQGIADTETAALKNTLQGQLSGQNSLPAPSLVSDAASGMDANAQAVPQDVQDYQYQAENLQSASDAGKFPITYFYQRLNSQLKNIRDNNPGYRDFVDATSEKTLGFNAANREWQTMLQQVNQAATNKQSEFKALETEAKKDKDNGLPGADEAYEAIRTGKIKDYGTYLQVMGPERSRYAKMKYDLVKDAADEKNDAVSQKNHERVAQSFVLSETSRLWKAPGISLGIEGTPDGASGEAMLNRLVTSQAPGGKPMSAEDGTKLRMYNDTLRDKNIADTLAKMSSPINDRGEFDPKGRLPSMIDRMGPDGYEKAQKMLTGIMGARYDMVGKSLTVGPVAVAVFSGKIHEAQAADADAFLRNTNPEYEATFKALDMAAKYPSYAQDYITSEIQKNGAKLATGLGAALSGQKLQAHALNPSDTPVTSQNYIINDMKQKDPTRTIFQPSDWKSVVDITQGIVDPKTPDVIKKNLAYRSFFPDNNGFLDHFRGEDKTAVFLPMTSLSMTKQMFKMGEDDPEYWNKYKNWAHEEWGNVLHQNIMDLKTYQSHGLTVSYNTTSNNWDVKVSDNNKLVKSVLQQRSQTIRNPSLNLPDYTTTDKGQDIAQKYVDEVRASIGDLNKGLTNLANVNKADKNSQDDTATYLIKRMLSVDPSIATMPGIPGDMFRAVVNGKRAEENPPGKGSTSPTDARGSVKNTPGVDSSSQIPMFTNSDPKSAAQTAFEQALEANKKREPIPPSKKWWGDKEAEDAGLYEPTNTRQTKK